MKNEDEFEAWFQDNREEFEKEYDEAMWAEEGTLTSSWWQVKDEDEIHLGGIPATEDDWLDTLVWIYKLPGRNEYEM